MSPLELARRRITTLVRTAALTVIAASLAAPAAATTGNPAHLASDQLAQVQQLCETNLHLRPGETHFEGCVAGLSDSLASASRASAIQSARNACFAVLSPDAPELGECLLNASETPQPSAKAISARSYFHASQDDIVRGEKLSCARLGFDPISGAFDNCVTNLAGALDAADRTPDQ